MKRFLKQLAGFLGIALAAYGILTGVYYYMYLRAVDQVHQLRTDAQILVLGDSHTECGINDLAHPIFENRARCGEIYYLSYFKLKFLLENPENVRNIKAICLGYTYFSLGYYSQTFFTGRSPLGTFFLDSYIPIMNSLETLPSQYGYPCCRSDLSICLSAYLPEFEDVKDLLVYRRIFNVLFKVYRGSFCAANIGHLDENLIQSEIKKMQTSSVYPLDEVYRGSELEEKMLRLLLALAKEHHIPVVLINTPEHPILVEYIPENIKEYYLKVLEDLKRDSGVYYLNYHEMKLDDKYFADFGHLNVDGANIFTPILLKDLKELKLIP